MEKIIIDDEIKFNELIQNPRKYIKHSKKGLLNITYEYPSRYDALINALSISNTRKRITFIYDNACETIDKYNIDHNLMCEFENGKCKLFNDKGSKNKINGCCYHCIYQCSTGCPTSNLTCKFYFCERMRHLKPLTFEDFPEFKLLTKFQQEIVKNNPYCKRETFLRLLYMNSRILFYLYSTRNGYNMLIAGIKNDLLNKKANK